MSRAAFWRDTEQTCRAQAAQAARFAERMKGIPTAVEFNEKLARLYTQYAETAHEKALWWAALERGE